jgi:ubiquinone/menaquinone biosynthesis C-methylase UbiE
LLAVILLVACRQSAPVTSANPGINDRFQTEEGRARAIQVFEGSERAAFQKPEDVVAMLELEQGDIVADIGAGSGYMTSAVSAAVGANGKVFAEDIVPGFLDEIRAKIAKHQLANVDSVLGTATDAKLPEACCNVIFVLDTYHHFEWPVPMLASLRKAIRPGGRLLIIEFHRKPNPMFERQKIDYAKHIPLDDSQVIAEIERNGWKLHEKKELPPYQYLAEFQPDH